MGTWDTAINGNDTFNDIYHNFFGLYNQGHSPVSISKQIIENFGEMFNDLEDRNNALFGLALAQWETKSLDSEVFKQVKEIVETGNDLKLWKRLEADDKSLKKRKIVLEKFLNQISAEREKPKRRVKPKFEYSTIELQKLIAPDNKKIFEAHEEYINGVYEQTGSSIMWDMGGGSVFYFIGQGKNVTANWIDSQTLEIAYDKSVIIQLKKEDFYFAGDKVKIIYVAK